MAPWSTATTPSRPATEPLISELLPDPATPVSTTSTPSGMSTSTSCRLWVLAPRTSSAPAGPQLLDRTLEDDLAAGGAGARAEVDDVVGDRDQLRLVLDDEHGVALVA